VGNTNIFEGVFKTKDYVFVVEVEGLGSFDVYSPVKKNWMIPGCNVFMSVRPEKIYISKKEIQGFSNHLVGTVSDIIYYGRSTQYTVVLENEKAIKVFEQNEEHFPQEEIDYDDKVNLYFQKENAVLLEG
jgi:ABC-type Fe3+/spermidine/putrescine transport system ATPase subunit